MPRAKRGFKRRRRNKKLKNLAEGFVLGGKSQIRRTIEKVDRAHVYAYRDRKVKKRDFRGLWIERLSAALGYEDISYSRFIAVLKKAKVEINRKMLSDIAIHDPKGFSALVSTVTKSA